MRQSKESSTALIKGLFKEQHMTFNDIMASRRDRNLQRVVERATVAGRIARISHGPARWHALAIMKDALRTLERNGIRLWITEPAQRRVA
jgi:hypothetical protein